MTNEEFQKVVLEEIRGLKHTVNTLAEGQDRLANEQVRVANELDRLVEGQTRLEEGQVRLANEQVRVANELDRLAEGQARLEEGQVRLEEGQSHLTDRQSRVEQKLDAVYNQTAILTEFRTETITKLNNISDQFKSTYEILGEHEVAIRTLKRKPV